MTTEIIGKLIPTAVLLILGFIESFGGLYFDSKRTKNDFTIELVSLAVLPTLVQPGIFLTVFWLLEIFLPLTNNSLSNIAIWLQVISFLIFDDLTQYWWHRLSHKNKTLWKLHRPHHVVEEMGVLVTYRNATLFYGLMPGIWFSAILVFLGMGEVYIYYLAVKLIVIIFAHSETKWDRFLYKHKFLRPLAWVIERIISTPATHFAHHGLTAEDGVSHPNGNFGNLLFFWDVLFGTSKITRKYPKKFGAWNQMKEPWYVQLLFPLIRSKDTKSELYSIKTSKDYDPNVDYKKIKQ
ncbi:sterol desaturase family protein [Polaribacter ponticola]|uniref:Sterol desaturase family protein n=1 Tax=Polaribacter ponticola TaxID=2978475 RepID=A0ABT5S5S7_9FLAO|nr:sterol desaturase family protein [Polaribacter sp. MSW5]MDD7913453.1 sterol desaturase family protein [Polaribacter sp. MSW5]